jgi:hypothetical protein
MFSSIGSLGEGSPVSPKRRLTREERRALEVLASEPYGATDGLLVLVHGLQIKMLAGLVREGLATAIVGEGVEADGKTAEVVRIVITDAGRRAIG